MWRMKLGGMICEWTSLLKIFKMVQLNVLTRSDLIRCTEWAVLHMQNQKTTKQHVFVSIFTCWTPIKLMVSNKAFVMQNSTTYECEKMMLVKLDIQLKTTLEVKCRLSKITFELKLTLCQRSTVLKVNFVAGVAAVTEKKMLRSDCGMTLSHSTMPCNWSTFNLTAHAHSLACSLNKRSLGYCHIFRFFRICRNNSAQLFLFCRFYRLIVAVVAVAAVESESMDYHNSSSRVECIG